LTKHSSFTYPGGSGVTSLKKKRSMSDGCIKTSGVGSLLDSCDLSIAANSNPEVALNSDWSIIKNYNDIRKAAQVDLSCLPNQNAPVPTAFIPGACGNDSKEKKNKLDNERR
jgi:hypothetical protein